MKHENTQEHMIRRTQLPVGLTVGRSPPSRGLMTSDCRLHDRGSRIRKEGHGRIPGHTEQSALALKIQQRGWNLEK